MRTGIIENGKDTGRDPFLASFPELLDIGIMGRCEHGKKDKPEWNVIRMVYIEMMPI